MILRYFVAGVLFLLFRLLFLLLGHPHLCHHSPEILPATYILCCCVVEAKETYYRRKETYYEGGKNLPSLHEGLEAALCVSIPSWYGLGLALFEANAVNEGLSKTNAVEEEGGNFCEERLVCAGIRC